MSDDTTKDAGVTYGGAYVESEDHVPATTDMYGQFNTSGTGAHHDPATLSPIFDADRKATAAEIKNALDPEHPTPSDRVLFAEPQQVVNVDPEQARKDLLERADRALEEPVVIGGPTHLDEEAALSGDEGAEAAAQQEAKVSGDAGAATAPADPAVAHDGAADAEQAGEDEHRANEAGE